MYVHFLSWLFYCVFCVFCVFIVLSVHFLSSACLMFVSSGFCIWASLPEIKRWHGMDTANLTWLKFTLQDDIIVLVNIKILLHDCYPKTCTD